MYNNNIYYIIVYTKYFIQLIMLSAEWALRFLGLTPGQTYILSHFNISLPAPKADLNVFLR